MATTTMGNLAFDIPLTPGPNDSISELRWSPSADYIASTSWDNQLLVYDVKTSANSRPSGTQVFSHGFNSPLLGLDWSKDGTSLAIAGSDSKAYLVDLDAPGSAPRQVAAHAAPIKSVRFVTIPSAGYPVLATGSWDSTVKFWDLRQETPAATITCEKNGKVYAMDAARDMLAVATSEQLVHVVGFKNPTKIETTERPVLTAQLRSIVVFPDGTGCGIGSIEGRTAFMWRDKKFYSNNYSFKSQRFDFTPPPPRDTRKHQIVFAVNSISFHPVHPVFATAGADGGFIFWNRDRRCALKRFRFDEKIWDVVNTGIGVGGLHRGGQDGKDLEPGKVAITSTGFNHDGKMFAYAVGYDWSKGHSGSKAGRKEGVWIHAVGDACTPSNSGTRK